MAFKENKLPDDAPMADKALGWINDRFPLSTLWNDQWGQYYAPKNLNFWYIFGSLALLVLAMQIVTGIFLVMHYEPDAARAFASVEYIMREVPWGWLVRYMHSTGASAFFIIVYLHMTRALLYGSYRKPRELVFLFGFGNFLCLMAEAFFGYLLPWGQMSYWGAQVMMAAIAAYVVLVWLKSRLAFKTKAAIAAAALLVSIGMLPQVLDAKFWGVVLFASSVMVLAGLPWLDHSPVKSIRYRPHWHKYVYAVFFLCFLALGYLGTQLPTPAFTLAAQLCTLLYFSFFLLMPWWSTMGTFKTVPQRVRFES